MLKETITKHLSEAEQNYVVSFAENQPQFESVRKVLSASLKDYRNKFVTSLLHSNELSNEDIGQRFRACGEAIRLVEAAFGDLAQFKTQPLREAKVHPGR